MLAMRPLGPLAFLLLASILAAQTTCPCALFIGQAGACVAEDSPGSNTCSLVDCKDHYACDTESPTGTCTIEVTTGTLFNFDGEDQSAGAPCSADEVETALVTLQDSPPPVAAVYALGKSAPSGSCSSFCNTEGKSCNTAGMRTISASPLAESYIIGTGSPSAASAYDCFDVLAPCSLTTEANDPTLLCWQTAQSGGCVNQPDSSQITGDCDSSYDGDAYACVCDVAGRRELTVFTALAQADQAVFPLQHPTTVHHDAIAAHVQQDLRSSSIQSLDMATCETVPTPATGASRHQLCCKVRGTDDVSCLPSIVVAGAQKSGSSFIHAALMQHSQVRHSTVGKELHFFDSDLGRGTSPYFYMLPPTSREHASRTVTIDSSPSYILRDDVCSGIHTLLPDAVVVVVLRSPKERAWSEYQMLYRQDQDLQNFNSIIHAHFQHLAGCVGTLTEGSRPIYTKGYKNRIAEYNRLVDTLDTCAPEALVSHSRWSRFKKNVLLDQINSGKWDKCFEGGKINVDAEACRGLSAVNHRIKQNYRYNIENIQLNVLSEFKAEAEHLRACQASNPLDCFVQSGSASDLTRHRLFRGMYALQLKQCMNTIPADRLVVLESAELRANPVKNINKVLRAAGLEEFDEIDEVAAWKAFHAAYPDFEQTGWREKGEYEAMSEEMETFLDEFYRPLNEDLFELLGTRFEHW